MTVGNHNVKTNADKTNVEIDQTADEQQKMYRHNTKTKTNIAEHAGRIHVKTEPRENKPWEKESWKRPNP